MFVTMDFEIADRILPSICSIAIITWNNGEMIDVFHSYVNPDCEVEEFFLDRHALSDEKLKNAPSINEIWIPIFDRLEHRTVFCWNPNQIFRAMLHKAEIEQLNMPNLNYGSVMSICKRTWKNIDCSHLETVTDELGITDIHNNALEDAKSLGKLIYMAAEHLELETPYSLFKEIGFAGGYIRNGVKMPYSAVKSKDKKFYITKMRAERLKAAD